MTGDEPPWLAFAAALAPILGLALALRLWYVTALPGQGRDFIFSDMATFDYLIMPFIACAFARDRVPAAPLVFVLAGQSLVACWDCRTRRGVTSPDPR